MNKQETDLLDELVADWKSEVPALNARPMLVVGRILRLGKIMESLVSQEIKPFGLYYTDLDILASLRRKGRPGERKGTHLNSGIEVRPNTVRHKTCAFASTQAG
jgi:hypothetical protein